MEKIGEHSNSLTPVAAYARMSTDHQKYSINNQLDTIKSYAENNNMEIVATFTDRGKSGLSLKGRAGLTALLSLVNSGTAVFKYILVFDVSRWGRFQDTDEAAFYEFQCKLNNIQVRYCSENFENDGSAIGTIVKNLKRAMAAEFSRELSYKIFMGHSKLIKYGFRQGGTAGYGLRRMLIDEYGNHKFMLQYREYKSIRADRVILVPGPEQEIEIVNRIFKLFVYGKKTYSSIARTLNSEGIKPDLGNTWSWRKIRSILTNEKYIGNNVYNRTSTKLMTKCVHNKPENWIRAEGVFAPIVSKTLFSRAKSRIKTFNSPTPKSVLLAGLKKLYKKHGYLSCSLIDASKLTAASTTIAKRFGSVKNAYKLVGYIEERYGVPNDVLISKLKELYLQNGKLNENIINNSDNVPSSRTYFSRFGSMYEAYRLVGYQPDKLTISDEDLLEKLKELYKQKGKLSEKIIAQSDMVPSSRTCRNRFGGLYEIYKLVGYNKQKSTKETSNK